MAEREIGKVDHYFSNLGVAVIELADALKVGDRIHIQGATSDFEQEVTSMQIEHEPVAEAKVGEAIGLKVNEKVRDGDKVFAVEP
jgi:translation elongation factor EF-1alpha